MSHQTPVRHLRWSRVRGVLGAALAVSVFASCSREGTLRPPTAQAFIHAASFGWTYGEWTHLSIQCAAGTVSEIGPWYVALSVVPNRCVLYFKTRTVVSVHCPDRTFLAVDAIDGGRCYESVGP